MGMGILEVRGREDVPIVFSFVGVAEPAMLAWAFSLLSVMVDVEGDREKVLAKGPKWVSLSFFVNFHDILAGRRYEGGGDLVPNALMANRTSGDGNGW